MLSDLISKENLRKLMSRYHNKIDDKNNDSIVKCNNCSKNKVQCFTPEERSIKINYCTTNQVVKPQSYCPKSEITSKQIHTKCNNSTCPYTTESISSTKADDTNRFRLANAKPTQCHSKNCPNLHPSTVGSNLTCLSATSSYTKWQIGSSKQSQSTCAQTSCTDNTKLHSSIPDTPLVLGEPLSLSSINEYFRKQYGADKVAIVLIKNPNKTDCSTKDDIRIIESPLQTKITCKQDKFTAKIEQKGYWLKKPSSKCREPGETNKNDNQPRVSALQKFSCENQQPVPHVCAAKRYMDETRRSKSQISFAEIQSFHKIQSGTPESRTSCKCPASRALIQPALKISAAQNNRDESVEKQSTKGVTKIKISDENKTQDKTSARSSSPTNMLEIQVTSSKTDESTSSSNKIKVCQAPCAVSRYKTQSETSSKLVETDTLKRMPSPKSSNQIQLADSVSKYKRPDEIDLSRRSLSPTYKFPESQVSKEFQPLSSVTKNKTRQDETSSRRSSSPKNIDKISPTNSKIKFKKSDETNSLRRSSSRTCKCPASQSSSYKTEKFQPTSSATKNKTQDQTSSRRSSPKNIKELRSTVSVTKYKSSDENGSSRRSPSPTSLHSVRSTSRSSPKNTTEVRLKSSPTKYKKSDKTDSSRRSLSPKNINKVRSTSSKTKHRKLSETDSCRSSSKNTNEIQSTNSAIKYRRSDYTDSPRRNLSPKNINDIRSTSSPTKYKRPPETLSRGSISSQYAKDFKMRFSSSKNRSDDINSITKSSLLRFDDPAESNSVTTNDSGTSRIVRHKEFQSNASIYLGSSSLHSNINEKQSIESRSKYKRVDKTSSSIRKSSPKNTSQIRPTVSEVKYKRSGKTDSSRSVSPENTDKVQSKISPTKYRKLNESELSGSSTKNKKLNKIDLMHRSSSPIDIDNVQWERNARKYKRPDDSHLPQRKSFSKSTKKVQSAGSDTSRSEVRPKSSTTKYRKPDGIDSKIRDRSSKNTNEVRSTRSTTKYRRSNESGSSRSSSPKKTNEVRPKSSPTKYKRLNETELSIRNVLPKNMNEIQSTAGKINNLNPIGANSSKRGTLKYKRPVGSESERHRSSPTSTRTETSRRSISPKSIENQSIISVTVKNNRTNEKHHLTQRIPEKTIVPSQISSIRRSVSPSNIDETQSICVCSAEQKKFTHEIAMLREKYSLNNSNKCTNPTCPANIDRKTKETASKTKISSAAQNYRKIPQRSASQMSTSPGFKPKYSLKLFEPKINISTKSKPFRVKSIRSSKSSEISIPTINLSKSKTTKKKSKNSISNSSRIKNKITPPKIIKANEYRSPTRSISQNRTNKNKIKVQKSTVSPAGSISPGSRQSARSQPREKCPQINMNKIILELDDIKSQSFESKKGCHQSRICSVRENRCSQLRRTCCANRTQSTCTGARQISPCLTQKLTNQQILSKLNENVCNFYQAAIKNTCKAGVPPAQQRPCSAPNRTCKSPCRNVCKPTTTTKISTPSKLPSNNFTSNIAFIERPCSAPSKACRAITCKSSTPTDMQTRQVCCNQSRQVNPTRQCGCSRKQESLNQVKTACCKRQSCNRQTCCKQDLIEPRLGIG